MKKFAQFVKNLARGGHLRWHEEDLHHDCPIFEWTAENPLKLTTSRDLHGHGIGLSNKLRNMSPPAHGTPEHQSFSNHHFNKLSAVHRDHAAYYKGDSYSTNKFLRHGKFDDHYATQEAFHAAKAAMHDHIKHMDQVTSHRTEHDHTVFRGGVQAHVKKLEPGHVFQDHGYTGTSFRHHIAETFIHRGDNNEWASPKQKTVIHVIHVPKGTKAHYIDVGGGGLAHEHEMVLHRGTKFKVTHHSEDDYHHYIHSRVVAQHPKDVSKHLPASKPNQGYSRMGYDAYHNGVQYPNYTPLSEPEHRQPVSVADKKKQKLEASIQKSKMVPK